MKLLGKKNIGIFVLFLLNMNVTICLELRYLIVTFDIYIYGKVISFSLFFFFFLLNSDSISLAEHEL